MRVVALSTGLRFREESDRVRDVCAAMEEAAEQDARIELPAPEAAAGHVVHAHEQLRRATGAGAVCTLPLAARGEMVGALSCEWAAGKAPGAAAGARLEDVAALCGPILALLARAEAGPLERTRVALRAMIERRLGADRSLARGVLVAATALLLLMAVLPVSYRVGARATLEGRVQRALVAGVEGYLAEANARAGDLVRAGDVLARLDDRDLRLEQRRRQSERAQLEKEYREALAASDRSEISILRARIDQAEAKLALVAEQLGRTAVVAPFDGVVLEGDLDQALGSPVELGSVLYEVAPLDGYRIVLEVDGRDIADVAPGQPGRLALSALPGRTLPLLVERITPVSTSEDGRHYFRVEATLEQPLEALRPGMEGVAKIEVGRRRLLWIWTHGLLDWLRLRLWSWLP
jgi:multidrug resistance efflux pump